MKNRLALKALKVVWVKTGQDNIRTESHTSNRDECQTPEEEQDGEAGARSPCNWLPGGIRAFGCLQRVLRMVHVAVGHHGWCMLKEGIRDGAGCRRVLWIVQVK